jgi:hypothetical protein
MDTFGFIERMSEAEQAEYDALDRTPLPAALLKKFRTPASIGWVEEYVHKHSRWCPAQRLLKWMMIAALIMLGAGFVFNAGLAMFGPSYFERVVDRAVVKALDARKVPHTETTSASKDQLAQGAQ